MDLMLAAEQMVAAQAQAAAAAAAAAYYQSAVATTAGPGTPVFAPPVNHMRMNPQAPPAPGFGLLPAPMNLGMGGMGHHPPPPPPPQQALNQQAFGDHAVVSNDYDQCVDHPRRYFNPVPCGMLKLKPDSFADAILSTTIGIAATTVVMIETVATAVGTETETGTRPRVEATGSVIDGGAVRGLVLATGVATEAETEVLGGAHLVIGIGLRGGTDAIGLLRDQGSDN